MGAPGTIARSARAAVPPDADGEGFVQPDPAAACAAHHADLLLAHVMPSRVAALRDVTRSADARHELRDAAETLRARREATRFFGEPPPGRSALDAKRTADVAAEIVEAPEPESEPVDVLTVPGPFEGPKHEERAELRRLLHRVARARDLDVTDLTGPSKSPAVVLVRWEAIEHVSAAFPRWSLNQIGRAFGGRNTSTILHALNKRGAWPRPGAAA